MREAVQRSANNNLDDRPGRSAAPRFMFQPVRTRILDDIESGNGLNCKVLSIVAPVGYGKTVLMSSLFYSLRASGELCFWVALDDRDTSVERLLHQLEMLTRGPEARLHPTQALFRGGAPVETRIESLLDAAAGMTRPFSVFIDNLNSCKDEALGTLLDSLIFRSPASARFVLSSTEEIPLNMARAKLEGLVRQVGYYDLSLDAREMTELLGPELSATIGTDGIQAVTRRTEGWPAAARMAQIVLTAGDDPVAALARFSGSDEDIAALLNRQVLSGFSADERAFLLGIAQLRTFNVDLCRHANNDEAADRHLALLLRRNLFVIPLDRNRTWYRLHGLFREFLLNEGERSLTVQQRRQVLARAAEWSEQNGYWRDAIDYALRADAAETACRILDGTAASFVRDQGDVLQYIEWIEALQSKGHKPGWEAEYWYIWALAFHRRYELGRQQCERFTERINADLAAGGDPMQLGELQRRIDIVRISINIFTDRLEDARSSAVHWLSEAHADDPFNVAAASGSESICYSAFHLFPEARRAAQVAKAAAFQAGSAYASGWISALESLVPVYEGSYASAYPELKTNLANARKVLGDETGICGTIALISAKAAAEMGLDDEAQELLNFGMGTSRTHGFLDAAACGLEAAVLLWSDGKASRIPLTQLREVASSYPPRLSLMLSCFLIRRLIVLGRMEEAQEEADRIGLNAAAPSVPGLAPVMTGVAHVEALVEDTKIDMLIASGKLKPAELLVAEESRKAKAANCSSRLVSLALAAAAIAVRSSQQALAVRHITRAVSIAATRGIVRPFRDQTEMLAAVVADTKVSAWGFATNEERKFFVDLCRGLTFSDQSLYDRLATLHDEEPQLLAQLTSRERELLGYIDAGLSNQQIADRIDVSLTTVKWHLQNMYAKLGVTNRSAALARARVLSLLSR